MPIQPGILAPAPSRGRLLFFSIHEASNVRSVLEEIQKLEADDSWVLGLGSPVSGAMGTDVKGLHPFPTFEASQVAVPSTQDALWLYLRGCDAGELIHLGEKLTKLLSNAFKLESAVDTFRHQDSRDLTGYIDGTENPSEEDSPGVAQIGEGSPGTQGGSFVTVQRWAHNLAQFSSFSQETRDHIIGRRQSDNEELDDAPKSAHVKRTAQESFSPEAFLVRRSMPYSLGMEHGLMFVSYAASLSPFEAQMNRMVGAEDGITDGLFRFSTPKTGAHYFCPPIENGKLDLSALLG